MAGLGSLDNIQFCMQDVLKMKKRVPGDIIETGVWQGGASIFMRAIPQGAQRQRSDRDVPRPSSLSSYLAKDH
jgi:hypothetical protein